MSSKRSSTILQRSAGDRLHGVKVLDWWIAQQPEPAAYRSDLMDACRSPLCTYEAIRDVLVEDGHPDTLSGDRVRKWWYQQPEYHEHS